MLGQPIGIDVPGAVAELFRRARDQVGIARIVDHVRRGIGPGITREIEARIHRIDDLLCLGAGRRGDVELVAVLRQQRGKRRLQIGCAGASVGQ